MEKKVPVSTWPDVVYKPFLDGSGQRALVTYFRHKDVDDDFKREALMKPYRKADEPTPVLLTKEERRAMFIALAEYMFDRGPSTFRSHRPEVVLDYPVPGMLNPSNTVTGDAILLDKSVQARFTKSWEDIQNNVNDFSTGWVAAHAHHQEAIKALEEAKKPKPKRNALQIAAEKACKKENIDAKEWADFIADLVNGTNGAYTNRGTINRPTVNEYSLVLARGIRELLRREGYPKHYSFSELYNIGADSLDQL